MVTNPPRGQLNREDVFFPVPVRALESGFARQVRPSHPASARLSPTLSMNLVLTHEIPPAFHDIVYIIYRQSGATVVRNCVLMAFTAESPPRAAAFLGFTMGQLFRVHGTGGKPPRVLA